MSTLTTAPGWFRVCSREEIRDRIVEASWRGHAVAVYLDGDGQPQVVQRFCPHLGASFAAGGRVEGGELVCPFHGWRFDARTGQVAQVPYSERKPPRACLRRWQAELRDGQVVAWDERAGETRSGIRNPLPPFPVGWFALCFSRDLPRSATLETRWLGLEVTVRRAADGRLAATAADGRTLTLDEQQGAILAWYHPDDAPPQWRIPEPDADGWTDYSGHVWRGLASHPQETSENSVDVAHFREIHGYTEVETLREAATEGHLLTAEYSFARRLIRGGPRRLATHTDFRVEVHGLGFSFVESRVRTVGIQTRQLVMATPTDGGHIDLRISAAVKGLAALGPLARSARLATLRAVMRAYITDVRDDFDVWQHKRYLDRPIVVDGDGPIHRYRQWARQFYVDPAEPGAASERIAS